jgi:hypothetical protein
LLPDHQRRHAKKIPPRLLRNRHWRAPCVKSSELHDGYVVASDERLTDLGLKESAAKILPAHSVLVAMYCAKRFTVKDSECAPEAATSRE